MNDGCLGRRWPLYFLHISKTGGTSLTDALARQFPPEQVFIGAGGAITVKELEGLGDRLAGPLFLAGHAAAGVVRRLQGHADIVTILRRPADQAVSNYLHARAYSTNRLHASAVRCSLADYLRENPEQITFQTSSIALSLTDPDDPASAPDLPAILAFLDSLPFTGVIEQPEACGAVLTRLLGAERPVEIPFLNTAVYRGDSAASLEGLRREYESLREDPAVAERVATEARVYERAVACLARLAQALPAAASDRRLEDGFFGPWRFRDAEGSLRGEAPQRLLTGEVDHLVFGPFERLTRGNHAVTFHLAAEDVANGRIQIEVLANGRTSLRRRWLTLAQGLSPKGLTLAFVNPDPANVLEFRVRARGCDRGRLVFRGVTVRPSSIAKAWPSVMVRRLHLLRRRLAPQPDGRSSA